MRPRVHRFKRKENAEEPEVAEVSQRGFDEHRAYELRV
jgi:hypothetical protein